MSYKDTLTEAMELLAKDQRTLFLGQSVACKGNAIYETLCRVPDFKRLEMPVAEDLQMGFSIGLSLEGYLPISIFPRMDFLILAINQLVNHLDKIETTSQGQFSPKVIIRTAIGSTKPLYPGLQHCSDYTAGLKALVKNVNVIILKDSKDIILEYSKALHAKKSTILVEVSDLYSER